jgi:AcrR family transcriptional regulator
MASRVGLDRHAVVRAAVEIVDREGVDALSMARLAAALGIRAPSLYAHVDGQVGLRRELWMWAVADLGDRLGEAVMGRSREEALAAFAVAFRDYVHAYRGRYQLTLSPPEPLDDEALAVGRRANTAFRAVIRSFGLPEDDAVHAGRAVRAAIHGFVGLEARYALGPEDVDESFRRMLDVLCLGLEGHRGRRPATVTVVPAG